MIFEVTEKQYAAIGECYSKYIVYCGDGNIYELPSKTIDFDNSMFDLENDEFEIIHGDLWSKDIKIKHIGKFEYKNLQELKNAELDRRIYQALFYSAPIHFLVGGKDESCES